jgi:hypothetical protein
MSSGAFSIPRHSMGIRIDTQRAGS